MQRAKLSPSFFSFSEPLVFEDKDWHLRFILPPYNRTFRENDRRSRLFDGRPAVRLTDIDQPQITFGRHFSSARLRQLQCKAAEIAQERTPIAQLQVEPSLQPLLHLLDEPLFHDRFDLCRSAESHSKQLTADPHFSKLRQTAELLQLQTQRPISVRAMALQMNISTARASYLLRRLKKSHGETLVADTEKLEQAMFLSKEFGPAVNRLMGLNSSKTRPIRLLTADFLRENPELPIRNPQHFRRLLLQMDFVH